MVLFEDGGSVIIVIWQKALLENSLFTAAWRICEFWGENRRNHNGLGFNWIRFGTESKTFN